MTYRSAPNHKWWRPPQRPCAFLAMSRKIPLGISQESTTANGPSCAASRLSEFLNAIALHGNSPISKLSSFPPSPLLNQFSGLELTRNLPTSSTWSIASEQTSQAGLPGLASNSGTMIGDMTGMHVARLDSANPLHRRV